MCVCIQNVKCEIANLRLPEYKCLLFYPRRRINLAVETITGVLLCYSNTTSYLILFFSSVTFLHRDNFLSYKTKMDRIFFSVNNCIDLEIILP